MMQPRTRLGLATRDRRHRRLSAIFRSAYVAVGMLVCSDAKAFQWVFGNVSTVDDNSAYSASYGILVELANATWGSGTTSNGASVCTGFRIVTGLVGITEEAKARYYAALLSQQAIGRPVALYVDTSVAPYCAVQVLSTGRTAAP